MNYDEELELTDSRRNTKNKKPKLKSYFEARSLLKNLKYNDAMNLIMDLYAILGKKENPNLVEKKTRPSELPSKIASLPNLNKSIKKLSIN